MRRDPDSDAAPAPRPPVPPGERSRVRAAEGGAPYASPAMLAAMTSPVHDPDDEPDDREAAAQDDRETERGLRGLVGGGASQVRVGAALRARDAARPTDEDLAAAEANLVIIRRGWTPPPASK